MASWVNRQTSRAPSMDRQSYRKALRLIEKINKILLIDDDEIVNIMYRRLIEKSERVRELLVAKDGQAALDLLDQHIVEGLPFPDLIFLDVNMPGMGGFEFLEEYAARDMGKENEGRIVVLSTSLLPSDHERVAADPNVHSFVDKIMLPETFLELTDAFLQRENLT